MMFGLVRDLMFLMGSQHRFQDQWLIKGVRVT